MSLEFTTHFPGASHWREACSRFENYNLYQVWEYAAYHSPPSATRDVVRCGVLDNGEPRVLGQFRLKKVPLVGVGVAELEWGPLWNPGRKDSGLEELSFFFERVREEFCGQRRLEVRVYPCTTYPEAMDPAVDEVLNRAGFEKVVTETRNYDTVILDLSKDLEELRVGFHPKWRNLLKKAEKSSMKVLTGREGSLFDRFLELYETMRQVKSFPTGVRVSTVRAMHDALPPEEQFLVSVAVDDGRDVGATVCAMTGQWMLYLLGATDPEHRGNAPGYLLQWNHLVAGKEAGMKWYDLGGLVSEGVSRFKIRMGGQQVRFPRRHVARPGLARSTLFRLAEKGMDWIRR